MRNRLLLSALCLVVPAFAISATVNIVDEAEDTNYTVNPGPPADSVVLANSSDATQGDNSLHVTFTYTDQGAWFKNTSIVKEFAEPVDMSDMEAFRYDIKCDAPDAAFLLAIQLQDAVGYRTRVVDFGVFGDIAAGEWETRTFAFSDFHKDQWVAQGRAANLSAITAIRYHIMNQAQSGEGTLEFLLDNVRFETGHGILNEIVLEDFTTYANDAALQAVWTTAFNSGAVGTLETANPYSGSQAMKLSASITGNWTNFALIRTLDSVQDFSEAAYFKVAMFGDSQFAGLGASHKIFLEDVNGRRVQGYMWGQGTTEEWGLIHLPFDNQGVAGFTNDEWAREYGGNSLWWADRWDGSAWNENADLSQIQKMILAVETQSLPEPSPYPFNAEVLFDSIIVGFETDAPPPPGEVTSVAPWVLYH